MSEHSGPSGLPAGPAWPEDDRGDGGGLDGWRIARVTGSLPTAVSFWLERDDGAARIQIVVSQRGEGRCLQATPLGDVSYHRLAGLDEREAAEITQAFAAAVTANGVPIARHFPHLAAEAAADDDAARLRLAALVEPATRLLGGQHEDFATLPAQQLPTLLYFDPPGIAEFLAPQLVVDGPPLLDWVFRGIYLPSVARRSSADFGAYILEFTHREQEQTARLGLRVDGDQSKAFARCGRLSLAILHEGEVDAVPMEIASLASWVAALLRLKSSAALAIRVPGQLAEVRAISHPARADTLETRREADGQGGEQVVAAVSAPPALNLALDPDCGQRCVFCSVKSYVTPTDAGAVDVDDIRVQLEKARDQGVRQVRLNGIDPLRHSRVLDVLELIRAMGFSDLDVFSTGRRLADADFRGRFLAAMPTRFTIYVPLYGVSPAVHDAVTGTPGAHAEVLAAIAALRAEAPAGALRISTILVRQNAAEIVPLLRWLRGNGLGAHIGAHLPYPMRPTTRDPYMGSAMRETELLADVLADVQALPADEQAWALAVLGGAFRHPCVRWQAERASALPVLGAAFPERAFPLAGTEYRSDAFMHASGTSGEAEAFSVAVVECPHAATCALAPVCPREHYAAYAQHFGLDEFRAVTPADLYTARPVGPGLRRLAAKGRQVGADVWGRVRAWTARP